MRRLSSLLISFIALIVLLLASLSTLPQTVYAVETLDAQSDADASVNNDPDELDDNFGGNTLLTVGFHNTDIFPDTTNDIHRSFLHFDISSLSAGTPVSSASLVIYKTGDGPGPDDFPQEVCAQRVTGTFGPAQELTVTWNNQPSATIANEACITVQSSFGFYSWDVTSIVSLWHNGTDPNNGFRLIQTNEGPDLALSLFVNREFSDADFRPVLSVILADPEFRVYLDSKADPPTSWTISENDTSFTIRAVVDNIGGKILNEVDLDLLNHTDTVAATGAVFNLQIGTEDSVLLTTPAAFIPVAGSYNWKIRGTYENETTTTADDVIEFWNFTLVVVTGAITSNFRFISAILHQSTVPSGDTTALDVTVKNTGTANLFIRIFFDLPPELIVSPNILTPDSIAAGVTKTFEFVVITSASGTFTLGARIRPVDVSDSPIGQFVERRVTLVVGGVPAVTTLSPSDVGISDVILEGKIDSLGGLQSATVYFILWETDDTTCVGLGSCASIVQVPQFGEVISFISNYRIYYAGLNTGVNYSYEFRLVTPSKAEFQGGVVRFSTPTEFKDPLTALRNGFAVALGLDAIVMGGILGIGVILILTILMAMITGSEKMMMVAAMGGTGLNLMMGWWPFWMFILIVVGMGIILFRLPQFQAETA